MATNPCNKHGSENVTQHRILVIEDQEDLAALYAKTLERAGYHVTNAFSGEEGIAEFSESGADCILLDMTLPEMNGASVLAELRRTDAQIPVIIITGETSAETRRECERLGVTAYLAKPPVYEEVLAAVARALAAEDTDEDYEVVTLRLPAHTLALLQAINPNLEQAIRQLCDERQEKARAAV